MNKQIVIAGLNHRSAPIEVRETVAFEPAAVKHGLSRLLQCSSVEEGVILSTCNRVEVVAAAADHRAAFADIEAFLTEHGSAGANGFRDHLYTLRGAEAVRHLFRVAASLDSMVVGEPQILGQIKEFYHVARESGATGPLLHRLFHRSFSVAKRVRSETGIGSRAVSVSSVAVDLSKRIFDRLENKAVLLIGAGKTGHLLARQLRRSGVTSLMVTNRTFERAVELAGKIHGSPILYEDFPRYLKLADLVIGCTATPEFIIDAPLVEKVLRERKQQVMFFIDIGDRRNFDPAINDLDNVYLYNIDDLKSVAEENLRERSSEAAKAEAIVDEEVQGFLRWMHSLEQAPTIAALRGRLEAIRRGEIEKSFSGGLRQLSAEQRRAVEDMTAAIVNKILHAPISRLKHNPEGEEDALYVAALKKLFDLESKE